MAKILQTKNRPCHKNTLVIIKLIWKTTKQIIYRVTVGKFYKCNFLCLPFTTQHSRNQQKIIKHSKLQLELYNQFFRSRWHTRPTLTISHFSFRATYADDAEKFVLITHWNATIEKCLAIAWLTYLAVFLVCISYFKCTNTLL